MARVALNTQTIDEPGAEADLTVGTDNGATWVVDGDAQFLIVDNGSAGTRTITVQTGGTVAGHDIEDKEVEVPAGEVWVIPIRDKRVYARPTGVTDPGKIYVDVDTVTSVSAGAFK